MIYVPWDEENLSWCPAGSVLPNGRDGVSLAFVGHSSSNGATIKIPYGVDVWLLQRLLH